MVNPTTTKRKSRNFLLIIIFLQISLYLTVLFDIPIARQVIGFAYFTFVPGFIFVKLMKLDKLGMVTTFLFSAGFSIAFLMFLGLAINESFPIFGLSEPLSTAPLLFVFSSLVMVGAVMVYLRGENASVSKLENVRFPLSSLIYVALPIMSIVGSVWVNIYESNFVIIVALISVALLFVMGVFSRKFLPPKIYPLAVLAIAVAILYHSSLISNYIVTFGSDVPFEYFAFKTTQNAGQWISANPFPGDLTYGRYHSMLSITILPTIYSTLLGLGSTWVFKIITPLIFSFVPLGLYFIWREYVGAKFAFMSVFLFVAQSTFYSEMLGLNRQMIAELFLMLLLIVVLNKKLGYFGKITCFMIFGAALVVSHYAIAEIFLFLILAVLIFSIILKGTSRSVTIGMFVFFGVVMFFWYAFTSGATVLDSFTSIGQNLIRQLDEFFNPASRGETILLGLGIVASPSIWNTAGRVFAYLTEGPIVVGFVWLIRKRMKDRSFWGPYFMFVVFSMAFLVGLIIVPGLAQTFNMTRFYHLLLFFLAPLCVMGVHALLKVTKHERKHLVSILMILVLVPYFLFQTGFVYEFTLQESWSIPLSKNNMSPWRLQGQIGYIDTYSLFGAQWLSRNVDFRISEVHSDSPSRFSVLPMYSLKYGTKELNNVTTVASGGVVYLSSLNVADGIIVELLTWNFTGLAPVLDPLSLVYNNGRSAIYQNTG